MFKNVFGLLALVVTVAAAFNVYGDFSEVENLARAHAQSDPRAEVFLSQVGRSPLAHTYVFVIKGSPTVSVRCARSAVLFGDYSCEKEE
jgi:hypothetical protein